MTPSEAPAGEVTITQRLVGTGRREACSEHSLPA